MTTISALLLSSLVGLLSKFTRVSLELSLKICEEPAKRVCPTCGTQQLIKKGSVHHGKPKC